MLSSGLAHPYTNQMITWVAKMPFTINNNCRHSCSRGEKELKDIKNENADTIFTLNSMGYCTLYTCLSVHSHIHTAAATQFLK